MRSTLLSPIGRRIGIGLTLGILLLSAACTAPLPPAATPVPPTTTGGGGVTDLASLQTALTQAGLTVAPAGAVQQPFLSSGGQTLTANGQSIQAFEYPDAAAADRDAAKIHPDGTIPNTSVMWGAQPHFYRAGRLLVIYVGTDATVLAALDHVVGPAFATGPNLGGPANPTPSP
jgi:hypothetical protein